jgi:hypothetical protein
MLTSRRDYILRIIDEVGQLLARVIFKRRAGADQEALEHVVQACERLFAMDADKLFQLTPDQHFALLVENEPPEIARNKILIYAALNAEAGHVYTKLGKRELARATLLTALRFTLRAHTEFSGDDWPDYAPRTADLLAALAGEPLDADTIALLNAARPPPP